MFNYVKVLFAMLFAFLMSSRVQAATPYDAIVTAADVSGLSTTAVTILAAVILIPLIFAGYRIVRKAVNKA